MSSASGSASGHTETAPLGTEAGRAFLQQRIARFAKVTALLSAFFLVFGNVSVLFFAQGVTFPMILADIGNQMHFGALAVTTGMWLATRSGVRSERVLQLVDLVGNVGSMSLYAGMSACSVSPPEARIDMLMLLIAGLTLTVRAVIVPTSARQTALVSAASCIPVWVVAWIFSRTAPAKYASLIVANSALWCLANVIVATLATRVIFGLRTQVVEAKQLGQYLLSEKIGEGAMGEVHLAQHALLRRPTAIKLLPPDKAGAQTISRFEREVQLTAKLTHPNTVAIYDFGRTPDGIFYYAMELLDGIDLERLVDDHGAQPPARVIHILAQMCGSLAEAHAIGLVHRDVKPANVILCERGRVPDMVKVVDFGLVKDVSGISAAAHPELSNVNTIVGTPLYLAPEAILSPDRVDGRADLYAVGAVGYFLLTGSPVFPGKTVMDVCAQHLQAVPVPPSERLGKPVPADLERVIASCLSKKPDERPETGDALRDLLLACDVPGWTTADARAWWREHGPSPKPSRKPVSAETRTALDVDFRARW
jgi:serine/threonine-protein kinase